MRWPFGRHLTYGIRCPVCYWWKAAPQWSHSTCAAEFMRHNVTPLWHSSKKSVLSSTWGQWRRLCIQMREGLNVLKPTTPPRIQSVDASRIYKCLPPMTPKIEMDNGVEGSVAWAGRRRSNSLKNGSLRGDMMMVQ